MKIIALILPLLICLSARATDTPATSPSTASGAFLTGADISMLPEIEKAGGVYRQNGEPKDAIQILRDHGCRLFRVRLFVHPDPDYARTGGAVQDLAYVRALARRIKAAAGQLLLDFHYADTWADPAKQPTPAEWKDLAPAELQQRVRDYTTSVLRDLQSDGTTPAMVQVGNEITGGILWPSGKVLNAPKDKEDAQWRQFAALVNAGAGAVRGFDKNIRIIVHTHGGGRPGLPQWFFDKFISAGGTDFDIMGLSSYPAWGDSTETLRQNMAELAARWHKDILVVETSYPWHQLPDIKGGDKTMPWPQSPDGQRQFLTELTAAVRGVPENRGIGWVYWYPEAIPVPGMRIWREGFEGLFDANNEMLPALDAFNVSQ